jgi:hypothetical protein
LLTGFELSSYSSTCHSNFKVVDTIVGNLLAVNDDLVVALDYGLHKKIRGRYVLVAIATMSWLEIASACNHQ